MYALIANGFCGLVYSWEHLQVLASIYPYPKFRKVKDEIEGKMLLERYKRGQFDDHFENYGETDQSYGFAVIDYIIDGSNLYVSIDTTKVGFIKVKKSPFNDTSVDNRPTMIKIIVRNINLNDNLISDHCVAINTILQILGEFVDVNICVPNISVYLALARYTGDNFFIRDVQNTLKTRLGGVSYTIKN